VISIENLEKCQNRIQKYGCMLFGQQKNHMPLIRPNIEHKSLKRLANPCDSIP
jgi:hypothetical protein